MKNWLSYFGSGILSCLLFLFIYDIINAPAIVDTGYDDIVAFERMVNEAIKENKEEYLSYAKQQQEILKDIKESVDSIKAQKEQIIVKEVIVEPIKPSKPVERIVSPPQPVQLPKKSVVAKQAPVRLPGSHWNVNGNNRYSLIEIANHLRTTHNIDPSGYTYEELTIMHDNLHNGHSAMGYSSKRTNCPDDACPK